MAKDAIATLQSRGVAMEVKRMGAHIVLRHNGQCFDFWPPTGKWRMRDNTTRRGSLYMHGLSKKSGRGLDTLLTELG